MLKDQSNVIVINATKLSFSSLHEKAIEQATYDEHKQKNLLDPGAVADKYEEKNIDSRFFCDADVNNSLTCQCYPK